MSACGLVENAVSRTAASSALTDQSSRLASTQPLMAEHLPFSVEISNLVAFRDA
jgi:hypothetical protein